MILATVDTGRFEFTVAAPDKDSADAYLLEGYAKHVAQYPRYHGIDGGLMRDLIDGDEVTYTELVVGVVLRDGESL